MALLARLPAEVRFALGDVDYSDPALHVLCAAAARVQVTTRRGPYPHTDDGVEVRRVFHQMRSRTLEYVDSQFKATFGCLGQVPTRGLLATQRFALGAVLVYRLTLLRRLAGRALKPLLQAA